MNLLKDNTERIISFDFGEKRIGIAITDPLKLFAIPLTTIKNDSKLWPNISNIFTEYKIIKIILGYPVNEDGTKTKITRLVEKFKKQLENKYKIEVELIDERYSSDIAWEHILESTPSKKKRRNKSLIDMNAAAVILEDYLKIIE